MDRAIASALVFWHRFTITRYLAASIIALAFDVALFSSLVALATDPTIASAAGYCAGIVVHWLVSANMVFTGKTRDGAALHIQRALFAGSALVGLAITVATVEILGRAGFHPIPAKGAAIGISFIAVYGLRKWGVFR
jgi:putative flippase GtrA